MDATLPENLSLFLVLIASLTVHEWAHAFVADKMGDSTPRLQGRLTLNPLSHIDPLGTVLIPLLMILFSPGFAILGWGRPVMIDPRNFKNRVRGDILTSLAGPAANILLALIVAVVFGLWLGMMHEGLLGEKIAKLGLNIISLNAVLAVFNLLPIPPLDGSHLMRYLVGMSERAFFQLAQWGTLILIVLINIDTFRELLGRLVAYMCVPLVALMEIVAGMVAR